MVGTDVFIGAVIVAIVQAIKETFPQVSGAVTTVIAALVGALVAVLAPHMGIASISVAAGVLDGLAAVGVHTVVSSNGRKNQTPPTV